MAFVLNVSYVISRLLPFRTINVVVFTDLVSTFVIATEPL